MQRYNKFKTSSVPCNLLILDFDNASLHHTTIAHTSKHYRPFSGLSQRCHCDVINNDVVILGQGAVDSPSPEVILDIKLGGLSTLNSVRENLSHLSHR